MQNDGTLWNFIEGDESDWDRKERNGSKCHGMIWEEMGKFGKKQYRKVQYEMGKRGHNSLIWEATQNNRTDRVGTLQYSKWNDRTVWGGMAQYGTVK